jgi:ADP-heptose:LPS heptosyltransferase
MFGYRLSAIGYRLFMKPLLLQIIALLAGLFIRRRAPAELRRVLVIKPDHLGDLLLATPALRALRSALPAAEITGLVGPWAPFIWARNPDLDRLLILPFPGFDRNRKGDAVSHLYVLLKYALLLRRGRYDAALLLRDDHWWGAMLALLAGIPVRVGHAYELSQPFLTHALPLDRSVHVAQQGLDVVNQMIARDTVGAKHSHEIPLSQKESHANASPLRFDPRDDERALADAWYATHVPEHHRLVVIHPGTGGPAKLWLPERWAAVGDTLLAREDTTLLLTGGPGEEALVAQIAGLMQRPPLTLAGKLSVGQLAALLGRASVVMGVDSGPLHLAVSQGVQTITLFGPVEVGRYGPWGDPERHRVLRKELFCSPCHVITACPRGLAVPECMGLIGVEDVIHAACSM